MLLVAFFLVQQRTKHTIENRKNKTETQRPPKAIHTETWNEVIDQ